MHGIAERRRPAPPDPPRPAAGALARPRPSAAALLTGAVPVVAVVAVDPAGLVPHGPLRWAAGTAVLLAAVALRRRLVLPPRAPLAAWGLLLAALALSLVTALDPLHAWIGTPDRRLGFLAWLGLAAACALGSSAAAAGEGRTVLRGGVLAAAGLAAGAAADALGWLPDDGVAGRLGGSLGQPAHLGAMAALLLPVAIAQAADRTAGRTWRLLGGAAAAGTTAAVLASQTRGAWLGLAAGGLPLLVRGCRAVVRGRGRLPERLGGRRALLASALLLGAVGIALAASPLGSRAAAGLDLDRGTAAGRLAEWEVAVRVIRAAPVTGVGPEGYRIAFPAAVDAGYGRMFGREVHTDRAHSGPLDVAAAGGLPAGVAFTALVVLVATAAVRATGRDEPLLVGAGAGVLAYAVQQLVLFPLSEVDPAWWVLAGVVLAADRAPRPAGRQDQPGAAGASQAAGAAEPAPVPVPARATATTRVIAATLLGAVTVLGVQGVLADREMAAAARLAAEGATARAAQVAADAARRRPDDIRLRFAAARITARGDRITDVDAALAHLRAGLRRSPHDPPLADASADLLLERARRSRLPVDADRAVAAARDRVAADPAAAGQHLRLARALAVAEQRQAASAALAAAARLDPDHPDLLVVGAVVEGSAGADRGSGG